MKSISIRELHLHTGRWIRQIAASGQSLIVLDRGRPAARVVPLEAPLRTTFADRVHVPGFEELPAFETDSARILEEDRR